MNTKRLGLIICLLTLSFFNKAFAYENVRKCITIARSYCSGIADIADSKRLIFILKNGSKVVCTDYDAYDLNNKTDYLNQLNNVDASDIIKQAYPFSVSFKSPLGINNDRSNIKIPINILNYSPGRFRNDKLLMATYGASKLEVRRNLRKATFLGREIPFTRANGAADALEKVSKELVTKGLDKLFWDHRENSGSIAFRKISGTNRISAHSYGMTIDLTLEKNKHLAQYWKWNSVCRTDIENEDCYDGRQSKKAESLLDVQIPLRMDMFTLPNQNFELEVVSIFEKHGFIWGGKWFHYDTMHFEFRPEFMGGNQACNRIVDKIKIKYGL